jgi:hypothetical protein
VDTGLWAALIAAGTSISVNAASLWWQRRTARQTREEERRSQAKIVLDRYRGPLLSAASDLGARIDNIRHRGFLAYAQDGVRPRRSLRPRVSQSRGIEAKLTTLFRFAQYFGWREVLRTEVQLLRFEREADTQLVATVINDIDWAFATDSLDQRRAMLWSEEQRGIGELMITDRKDGASATRGYATFVREHEERFKPWMDEVAGDLLSPAARESDRLRLLQWALLGLVTQLDEERAHTNDRWIERARKELLESRPPKTPSKLGARIKDDIAKVESFGGR